MSSVHKLNDKIIVQGNAYVITIAKKKGASSEEFLLSQQKLLKNILVFATCPNCKREVLHIDLMRNGKCCFCYYDGEDEKKDQTEPLSKADKIFLEGKE